MLVTRELSQRRVVADLSIGLPSLMTAAQQLRSVDKVLFYLPIPSSRYCCEPPLLVGRGSSPDGVTFHPVTNEANSDMFANGTQVVSLQVLALPLFPRGCVGCSFNRWTRYYVLL